MLERRFFSRLEEYLNPEQTPQAVGRRTARPGVPAADERSLKSLARRRHGLRLFGVELTFWLGFR